MTPAIFWQRVADLVEATYASGAVEDAISMLQIAFRFAHPRMFDDKACMQAFVRVANGPIGAVINDPFDPRAAVIDARLQRWVHGRACPACGTIQGANTTTRPQ